MSAYNLAAIYTAHTHVRRRPKERRQYNYVYILIHPKVNKKNNK
jgi:hypothetical protein